MTKGKKIWVLIMCFWVLFNITGCIKNDTRETAPVAGTCSGSVGPLFTAVKTLVNSRCVSCHNNIVANGGMNFSIECNIVTSKTRIKVRAVDEGTMPQSGPLSASDKAIISTWTNAGGKYTD